MKPTPATVVMLGSMLVISLGARPAAADTTCKVEITGDKTLTVVAPTDAAEADQHLVLAGSDYWQSEKSIRGSVSFQVPYGTADKDKEQWIEKQMKKDPRVSALVLSCRSKDFGLGFQAGQGTKYAQVPMKPKKYTLAKGNAPAGDFEVIGGVVIGPRPRPEIYRISEPGTIEVTQFTGKHVTAKFSFKATLGAKKINVAGTFSADCTADKCGK